MKLLKYLRTNISHIIFLPADNTMDSPSSNLAITLSLLNDYEYKLRGSAWKWVRDLLRSTDCIFNSDLLFAIFSDVRHVSCAYCYLLQAAGQKFRQIIWQRKSYFLLRMYNSVHCFGLTGNHPESFGILQRFLGHCYVSVSVHPGNDVPAVATNI